MGQERFRKTGEGSFFGELVYQRAVPQEHFLRKLRELLPWEALTQEWVALYKGGAEYGPPLPSAASPTYRPSLVLKMQGRAIGRRCRRRQRRPIFGSPFVEGYPLLGQGLPRQKFS